MSRMQKEESLITVRRARVASVLMRALALTSVVLAVSLSHAGCDSGVPTCSEMPGTCGSLLPSDQWRGPLALWQGPAANFVSPVDDALFFETKREFYPLDYHPELDVEPFTCPLCTCAATDYCYGGAVWTGYQYDCADLNAKPHDIWAKPEAGLCHPISVPFGGALQCVGSLEYPTSFCASVYVTEPSIPAPTPEYIAVAYDSHILLGGTCDIPEDYCVPAVEGYEVCIAAPGDVPCEGRWADAKRYVFADGYDDWRNCKSVCECSPQQGSTCEVRLDVFSDDNCMALVESGQITGQYQTVAIDPPSPVNSLLVTLLEYTPGTCELPVGNTQTEPVGDIKLGPPVTFCCR